MSINPHTIYISVFQLVFTRVPYRGFHPLYKIFTGRKNLNLFLNFYGLLKFDYRSVQISKPVEVQNEDLNFYGPSIFVQTPGSPHWTMTVLVLQNVYEVLSRVSLPPIRFQKTEKKCEYNVLCLLESSGKSTNRKKTSGNPAWSTHCDSINDRPRTVPRSQSRVELLRADWSPMHFERLRFPFSNKKFSNSSVGEEKCWEIDEIDEGDDVQCTCKRS